MGKLKKVFSFGFLSRKNEFLFVPTIIGWGLDTLLILLILLGCLPNISMSVTGLPLVKMSKIIEKDILVDFIFIKNFISNTALSIPKILFPYSIILFLCIYILYEL